MITENTWRQLAAPIDADRIKTRDQSGTTIRYIDARTVIDRLNDVVPGEWHFTTELLHIPTGEKGDKWVFKGRLVVGECVQEDVGMNDNEDYFDPPKSAVSDALKRCAVHFGIGIELYGKAPAKSQSTTARPQSKPAPKAAAPRPFADPPAGAEWARGDLKQFWAFTKGELKLNEAQVHEALGVESVRDYPGRKDEAMVQLERYAAKLAVAEGAAA